MRFSATRVLWALAISALILPVIFFALLGWRSYNERLETSRLQLSRTVDVIREHTIRVFEMQRLVAAQVDLIVRGMSDEEIRANEPSIAAQLRKISSRLDHVQDIRILDRSGHVIASGRVNPRDATTDLSDREYFLAFRDAHLGGDEIYVSRVLRDRLQNDVFFQVVTAREDLTGGAFTGVVAIAVEPLYFREFFAQIAETGSDTASLVREDGAVLARFPGTPEGLESLPLATTFTARVKSSPVSGSYSATSPIDGEKRFVAYQRIPGLPVYVIAGLTDRHELARWQSGFLSHLVFGIPATLALFFLCLLALRLTGRETAALEQLRAEAERRESAEGQLRQSQKMEAVGRLTGGVAHDFNNLLTIVMGNLDMLRRWLGDADERTQKAVENAYTGATRAATLTQRLLAFSRQQPLAPAAVDVNRLVANMSDLLRRTLGETVAVETVLAGGLWPAHVDANQLESAILNLAVNARDAMPNGGKLTIEAANAYLDDAYAATRPDVAAGQYVMVSIADTGTGMSPDVVAQAFDPFFTTKPVGQGTGLGLSQVYGFAKQSNGHVSIYSEIDHGTAIKLYLPKLTKAMEQEAVEVKPASVVEPEVGEGTILVVEDDEMVRRISVDALEDAGYAVIHSEDARRGLALLNGHPEIDMLFTDVVLTGGMNGRALAEEAIKMRPGLKVLFTTGYTQNAIVHQGRLDEGINFIGKPFSAAALVSKVQAILKA
jgi:signal transduction histidine kinase/CheY-like chemotaxis protein